MSPRDDRTRPAGGVGGGPLVRAGAVAWALIGLALLAVAASMAISRISVVVVPLVLALFPAALLAPLVNRLARWRVPRLVGTLVAILGTLALLAGVGTLLAPQVSAEVPRLIDEALIGYGQLVELLEDGPLGLEPVLMDDVLDDVQQVVGEIDTQRIVTGALGAALAVVEVVVGTVLLVVALFFYLKDGPRMARWAGRQLPAPWRGHGTEVTRRVWWTLGAYFRGQLLVALADAALIGVGLWLLGVPLALPLAVVVFLGGLFPVVGAFVSGTLAVLVALADGGPVLALAVLALVVAVQQLESNLLAPIVLGRATKLHPLAVVVAITAGGVLLGLLGAFIAVPLVASVTRGVAYLRDALGDDEQAAEPAAAGG